MTPDRLILITDTRVGSALPLIEEVLSARRHDLQVVAVCDTTHFTTPLHRLAFIQAYPQRAGNPRSLKKLCADQMVPILELPGHRLHDQRCLTRLRALGSNLVLSLGCLTPLRPSLLQLFDYGVNYHNGRLPERRGLMATGWSIYEQDQETGFSYHRLTTGLDEGPVLLQGSFPFPPDITISALERMKTKTAKASVPQVLDLMVKRYPGLPQTGRANYHSRTDRDRIRFIVDPNAITWAVLAAV